MATTFNMQDFNEILEKCRDQSQQKKQDQVDERFKNIEMNHKKSRRKRNARTLWWWCWFSNLFLDSSTAVCIYSTNSWKASSKQTRSCIQFLAVNSDRKISSNFWSCTDASQFEFAVSDKIEIDHNAPSSCGWLITS